MGIAFDTTTRLLLGLALLLGLSRCAGRAASRLGQPAVLAEITVGIALGPSLLGRLLPGLHRQLFGTDVLAVFNGLAQLGVALYAFEIGAHLAAPARQPANRGRSPLLLAVVSLTVPAVGALLLAPLLQGDGLGGPHSGPAALTAFLACAFGVTAVPVLARILQDRSMEHTAVGRLSLAAASIGDGACWCLLALALWLSGQTGLPQLAVGVGGVVVAGLVAGHRSRRPARAGGADREWATGAVLGAVCLAAAASSALGLHVLFGGLVLGLLRPARPTPERGWQAPGVTTSLSAALLPCFFLGAGQQIDLGGELTDPSFLGLVALLLATTLVSKLAASTALGPWYGFGARDSLRLGVLMNTKGLTEIVVLTGGYQSGLIGQRLFEALLVVALACTLPAGPALSVLNRRERPGSTEAGDAMTPEVRATSGTPG